MKWVTRVLLIICLGTYTACVWVSVRQHTLSGVVRCLCPWGPLGQTSDFWGRTEQGGWGREMGWSPAWLAAPALAAASRWFVSSSAIGNISNAPSASVPKKASGFHITPFLFKTYLQGKRSFWESVHILLKPGVWWFFYSAQDGGFILLYGCPSFIILTEQPWQWICCRSQERVEQKLVFLLFCVVCFELVSRINF